jgi:hypothetical protein
MLLVYCDLHKPSVRSIFFDTLTASQNLIAKLFGQQPEADMTLDKVEGLQQRLAGLEVCDGRKGFHKGVQAGV